MTRAWIAALALALGCGDSQPAAGTAVAAEPTPAAGDAAPTASAPVPEAVRAALAGTDAIAARVSALRGHPLAQPVRGAYQTGADYRAHVAREIDRELGGDAALYSRIAYRVGWVREPLDLRAVAIDALADETAAYYDPDTRTFYVLSADDSEASTAHELVHAIQDQRFDLTEYYRIGATGARDLTEDQAGARQFVVEGEASFVEAAFDAAADGIDILGDADELDTTLAVLRLENWLGDVASDLGLLGDDRLRFFLDPMLAAYGEGTLFVADAYRRGGWSAVDALFTAPPASTEQVLHPGDKLFGERDEPVAIPPVTVVGWPRLETEVLGELSWRSYFRLWSTADAAAAAAGWDGDRMSVFERDGVMVAVFVTTWDSAGDAREFADAYREAARARFDGDDRARPDGTRIAVEVRGADVVIVDGAPEAELAGFVAAGFASRSSP